MSISWSLPLWTMKFFEPLVHRKLLTSHTRLGPVVLRTLACCGPLCLAKQWSYSYLLHPKLCLWDMIQCWGTEVEFSFTPTYGAALGHGRPWPSISTGQALSIVAQWITLHGNHNAFKCVHSENTSQFTFQSWDRGVMSIQLSQRIIWVRNFRLPWAKKHSTHIYETSLRAFFLLFMQRQ